MPVNANFYYKMAKDASYVTLRNQNRMLYANYRIQQNNVQQGCQIRVGLENGGVADYDIIPKLLEGALATTAAEIQIDISSAACPVTIAPVVVDPYATDKIYASLTTNAAAYKAAATNSWIKITSAEYTALKTTVSSTTTIGATNTLMDTTKYSAGTAQGKDFFQTVVYNGTQTIVIPTSSYFFAFSFVYSKNNQTGNRVYINSDSASQSGYIQQGGTLPATSTGSDGTIVVQYYVLKGQNTATSGANTTSIAFYDAITSGFEGLLATTQFSGPGLKYVILAPSGTLPTSSTAISNSLAGWVIGIQGVVASSIQWVT